MALCASSRAARNKTAHWPRFEATGHAEGGERVTTIPTGKFMVPAIEPGEALAYVLGGEDMPKMIPESEHRSAGYEPPFETLPTLDEFERAEKADGAHEPDAGEAPE
jgi:hypothetical protein